MTLAEKLATLRPGGSWRVVYGADGAESVQWGIPAQAPSAAELLGVDKRARQAYINARRDAVIAGGVAFNGWTFDTDTVSVNNLTAAVAFIQAAPGADLEVPASVSWRDAGNTDRALTPAQLVGLGAAIFTLVQTAHYTARQLKDAIETATSEAEINAIDWPA